MLFNIIWASIPVVIVLTLYLNLRQVISGNKNIIIGVTIPYLELKNEKVTNVVKKYKKEYITILAVSALLFIPSFFFKLNSYQMI